MRRPIRRVRTTSSSLLARTDKAISTKFGLGLVCNASIYDLQQPLDTVLVSGSDRVFSDPPDAAFHDWLRSVSKQARRIGSVCTGAFYLAQAGLLDGHKRRRTGAS